MEKMINRNRYYNEGTESFMIYLISRLYNDLNVNKALLMAINSESDAASQNAKIYLFKILVSHLKEGLKILGIMQEHLKYKNIFKEWMNTNKAAKQIVENISDELKKPKNYPNSVNAKFLNVRDEVFHYCIEKKDIAYYKKCQQKMLDENYDVCIECDEHGNYLYEIGIDIPITKDIFSETAMHETSELSNKVIKLLREILNDYYGKIQLDDSIVATAKV